MNVYSAQLKCQRDAVWHCDVSPVYFGKALLQRLICKWLSCDDGFVVRRVESLVVLTDVAGRCCNYWGKKKKKVNLVTSRALNPCVCVCVCAWAYISLNCFFPPNTVYTHASFTPCLVFYVCIYTCDRFHLFSAGWLTSRASQCHPTFTLAL